MPTHLPSESELKEAQARRGKDLPEPTPVQVSSGFAQREEEQAKLDAVEERVNDALASDVVMRRMRAMEEQFAKQNAVLMQALSRMGFASPDQEKPIVAPPVIPIGATIQIYINAGTSPEEQEPVFVCVNGENARYIPRGMYVHVTEAELGVLQNAVFQGYEYRVENDIPLAQKTSRAHFTPSVPVAYSRPRFPLMVNKFPG